ncbi:MAG TPA: hypothetical protein PLD84_04000, partial [Chitinophagales bacterium]|nr:hypothetical protein [Chitinophagales bacterium]
IIILLRNPVEMLYALHSNHVFNDNEIIADFETALNAQDDRKKGLRISPAIKCPVEGLYYYDVAAYALQVKRYLDLFGSEQVKVILFDDFVTHTKEVYRELLKFLEVEEIVPDEFEVFNASKTTRSGLIKKVTVHTPAWVRRAGRWLFPHQTARRDWLMFWLWKINTKEVKRRPLDPALRMKIATIMKAEIEALEILLGRDLSHWR